MRDSRKLEELILSFVTAANKMTDKSPDVDVHSKHLVLDQQLDYFITLLEDVARLLGPGTRDLLARLQAMRPAPVDNATPQDIHETSGRLGQTVDQLVGHRPVELQEEVVLQVRLSFSVDPRDRTDCVVPTNITLGLS
jgi:hypothetical protein